MRSTSKERTRPPGRRVSPGRTDTSYLPGPALQAPRRPASTAATPTTASCLIVIDPLQGFLARDRAGDPIFFIHGRRGGRRPGGPPPPAGVRARAWGRRGRTRRGGPG